MRILHVASSFPPDERSGIAPFMGEMLSALTPPGHQVRIIVPHIDGLTQRRSIDVTSYRYAPLPLQTWGYGQSLASSGRVRVSALLTAPSALVAMTAKTRREIARWKPDVLHLHWLLPQGVLALATRSDLPVVMSLHGADVSLANSSILLGRVAAAALRRSDHIVAASEEMLGRVAGLEPSIAGRSSVIPHGANATLFHPQNQHEARRRLEIESDGPVLLAVGRFVPKKGFDYLIRSMPLLAAKEAHLYLAGDGPTHSDLATLANEAAPGRVTFLGMVDRDTLSDWYSASDLVVVPSVQTDRDIDSGPVVLMEALASGRAVISTPVGMAPAVVTDDHNGFLVPEADPAALAQAISVALPQTDRLGANAADAFQRIGGWDRVARELEEVYEAAVTRRASLRH